MRRRPAIRRTPGLELQELLDLQERRPFRPCVLPLVSGQSLTVARPEDLHVNFTRQRLVVFEEDGLSLLSPTELARVKLLDSKPR